VGPYPSGNNLAVSVSVNYRILLVEDDPSTSFASRSFFEGRGVHVDHASTASEAIGLLRGQSFDGVVTDLRLADDDLRGGLKVAALAQQLHPGSRVVMVTAFASRSLERESRYHGIHRLLRKPVGLEELADAVLPDPGLRAGA
jgi:CheY-like chemotaxis protein